jgi:hypothetical protein
MSKEYEYLVNVLIRYRRSAGISTTMDQYGNASAVATRKANRPIVKQALRRK